MGIGKPVQRHKGAVTTSAQHLAIGMISLTLVACANNGPLSVGVTDPCTSLSNIVDDYPSGFEKYRGAGNDYHSVTLFRAKEQLVKGHCEIWSWSGGDHAYVCTANALAAEVAAERYQSSVGFVSQCLGSGWTREIIKRQRDGLPLGEATRFTSSEAPGLVVSVENLNPKKSYRQWHSNYLYIGSQSRAPSRQPATK